MACGEAEKRMGADENGWERMKDTETPDEKRTTDKRVYICDRCGAKMVERSCKVSCPNCGNRFDCSDLNIYFD